MEGIQYKTRMQHLMHIIPYFRAFLVLKTLIFVLKEVTSEKFLRKLSDRGCKAVIFVEFVPVTDDSVELAPGDEEQSRVRSHRIQISMLGILPLKKP